MERSALMLPEYEMGFWAQLLEGSQRAMGLKGTKL